MTASHRIGVGDHLVDFHANRIIRIDRESRIPKKAMAVLHCLTDRAGEVVTRRELFADVWPNQYRTDDVLTQMVGLLRRAFDDDIARPAYIETIPKVGYRLIAEVSEPTGSGLAGHAGRGNPDFEYRRGTRPSSMLAAAATVLMFLMLSASDTVEELPAARTVDRPDERAIVVLPVTLNPPDAARAQAASELHATLIATLEVDHGLRVEAGAAWAPASPELHEAVDRARVAGAARILETRLAAAPHDTQVQVRLLSAEGALLSSWDYGSMSRFTKDVRDQMAEHVGTAIIANISLGCLQEKIGHEAESVGI